ncbi:MAG TPA: MBL fold metallo-hydrolase [Candidatus Nitrosocosmicus sp.]|nr:MBL fold metallo-hydrolase [Bacteroidia bacterium]HKU83963.1 MBL fold metallo-hydrolase [Candidatus Nitrosocosmicus sp.]
MMNIEGIEIRWNGHDGFRIEVDGNKIYVDPYKLIPSYVSKSDADIILISHNHFDHLSIEDINNIINENTKIICSHECVEELKKNYVKNEIIPLKPKEARTVGNIEIRGIEAYNTDKKFHPKKDEKIGFIINVNNLKIYHTGDTDIIPEMENVSPDILFVPVSGTYVMTAKEAGKATNELIKPKKIAIPMHYGSIVGTVKDAEDFCKDVNICKTAILEIE